MRFDDSLKTVLSADQTTGFGARSTWRQLVDLMGRGRVPADEPTIARLRMLRGAVPAEVRAASARALAFAAPPAPLVGFFAEDELPIAAAVLRTAMLRGADWTALLPRLTPATRAVLRHRRDLPDEVVRGLESLGSIDLVLRDDTPAVQPAADPVAPSSPLIPDAPLDATPFMALGDIARGLPVVAEALRHAEASAAVPAEPSRFEIADLVKRIEAFRHARPTPELPTEAIEQGTFRYETDETGVIRWVEGVARTALVGVSLAYASIQGSAQIDGVAAGGFRRRSDFSDARLEVGGLSDAAGSWRVSGVPVFDHVTGRFTGMRGTGRRPRADESASPVEPPRGALSDSLRQLVHELRTPTNAIAGFAELIETQLLGPVHERYRDRAAAIRGQVAALIAAIDDLDVAARIDGGALELRASVVPVLPLLGRIVDDLTPLARLRGARIVIDPGSAARRIAADDRAVERLLGRLLATLVSAARHGERIGVVVASVPVDTVTVVLDRPVALNIQNADTDEEGAPLLGTAFSLRLAQNLAAELGGHLAIGDDRLTLRLPAEESFSMEMATTN